jgi:hypothetical protein
MAKRRQGRGFWAKLVSEFESSDERHAAFASRRGVRLTTFRAWLYRLRRQEAPLAKRAVRVLPVTVVGAGLSGRDLSIDCNGVALRFTPSPSGVSSSPV